jgi:Flp pilus assembly protein TadG
MRPPAHIRLFRAPRALGAWLRAERGVAVVEFALILPLLLLIVVGIMDFGRAMNYKNAATQLANEAARYLTVNRDPVSGATPTCGSIKSHLQTQADTPELATLLDEGTVTIGFPAGASNIGDPVQVTVNVTFSLLPFTSEHKLPLVPAFVTSPSVDIDGLATMRLEQAPGFGAGTC